MSKTEAAIAEKKPLALKDNVLLIAQQIEAAMAIDAKTGIITTAADIYEKTLPDGLTLDIAKAVHTHDTNFVAGAAHAAGAIAVAAMKSHKKLDNAETVIQMVGKNVLSLNVERSHTYANPQDKENPIVKHGVVTIAYDVVADNNAGQLKIAKSIISELATASLK